jgi:hypothetical protein
LYARRISAAEIKTACLPTSSRAARAYTGRE